MKNDDISTQAKDNLSNAYKQVYEEYVKAYQAKGLSLGQSQYNASCAIHEIVTAHKHEKDNPVIKFLIWFDNKHFSLVAKECMTSKEQNHVEPVYADKTEDVLKAITNFESIISAESPQILCVFKPISEKSLINYNTQKKQNFSKWIEYTANSSDFEKLENDPSYFGILYRRYVMRQSHK